MNNIETMKLALEALETNNKAWKSLADSGDAGWWEAEQQPFYEISVKAITSLRQAIEQAQQAEPFCYVYIENGEEFFAPKGAYVPDHAKPLYTTPPPRQPLTWEQVLEIGLKCANDHSRLPYEVKVARAIEAAHGIKGEE